LRQHFLDQLEDRRQILILGLGQIEIFFRRIQAVEGVDFVFGNIDAPRVMRVGPGEFLQRALPLARRQPVDEQLGRVGVGRAIGQA
jgi:hypothetical protein